VALPLTAVSSQNVIGSFEARFFLRGAVSYEVNSVSGATDVADDSIDRTIRTLNRLARASLWGFAASFSLLLLCVPFLVHAARSKSEEPLWVLLTAGIAVLSTFVTGVAHIGALQARDMVVWKRWRFSLFQLFWMMTSLAVGLGLLILAMRE
jgi:hypothetical protein